MLFEGFGVGLLVPLLNLLLGGERATPMRPLQWLERTLPGHSPAFYIGAIAVAIVVAVAREERRLLYLARARGAVSSGESPSGCATSCSGVCTAPISISSIGCPAASSPTSSSSRPTGDAGHRRVARRASSDRASRSSIWRRAVLPIVAADGAGARARRRARRRAGVRLPAAQDAGVELTELNHRMSRRSRSRSRACGSCARPTHRSAEIERFHALNVAQAGAEERSAQASSLAVSADRDAGGMPARWPS